MRKNELKEFVKPVRLPQTFLDEIKRVAEKVGLSEVEVMRLAMRKGLPVIERVLTEDEAVAA